MSEKDFTQTEKQLPPRDETIEWLSGDGTIVRGRYCGGAIWYPEWSSMYIYYTPKYWRLANA